VNLLRSAEIDSRFTRGSGRAGRTGLHLRRGRFALPLRAVLTVEPVVGTGARLGQTGGGEASPVPRVGALLHAAPGVVWWLRSERAAVRAFVDLELAASVEARARPGVLRYVEAGAAGRGLGRAGGLELGAGVGVGGWFAVRGRSP